MKVLITFLSFLFIGYAVAQTSLNLAPKKDGMRLAWEADLDTNSVPDEFWIFLMSSADIIAFENEGFITGATYDEIWEWQIGGTIYGMSDKTYEYFYWEPKAEMKNNWIKFGVVSVENGLKSTMVCTEPYYLKAPKQVKMPKID